MTLSEDIFNRDENNHNVKTASYDIIVTYKNSDMVSRCSVCVVTLQFVFVINFVVKFVIEYIIIKNMI